MDITKYRCLNCRRPDLAVYSTLWRCGSCGQVYPYVQGIPKLYLEEKLAARDRKLRDRFYGSLVGSYYGTVMPFLTLPARPWTLSWRDWIAYAAIMVLLAWLVVLLGELVFVRRMQDFSFADVLLLCVAAGVGAFLYRHAYLLHLLVLAIPVKLSLLWSGFAPAKSFTSVHADVIEKFRQSKERLQVLDISTGTCASLYRHGWMELNAEYTALDLSETMLVQGLAFMAGKRVPVDFALADAADLPLQSETFDIVLNYGAINGMSDPARALREMSRVTKKGGLVLFLDEQLYPQATAIEQMYFRNVLSSHNVIHHCPVELLPPELTKVEVNQVYQFYYICTAVKG